ncbi:hypothetical protein [Rhodanobacter sp. MP7CTX1]|uniref:hypothetical protein n=1 Tax=Rhodanobacter sp. MP7CTX1 TaxID=2723084 RepID=UPI00160A7B46|nr:hypothetical protein [Rhodanobacter sp. MP7CTX1]MBB6189147.1 hypothetical protein [Rhodanobacter sp. MP7CTX1]
MKPFGWCFGSGAAKGLPAEREALGMAARQSRAFCRSKDLSQDGCELRAALMKE